MTDTNALAEDQFIERCLNAFRCGLVRRPDGKNPRGYVDYYSPHEAMRKVVDFVLAERATDEHPSADDYRNRAEPAAQALAERDAEIVAWAAKFARRYEVHVPPMEREAGAIYAFRDSVRRGDYRSASDAE